MTTPSASASASATPVIAFIGGGNMASSLIGGLLANNFDPAKIRVSDPLEENRARLAEKSVATFADNREAATGADVLVLAVKPQVIADVARELAPALQYQPLVISIAAGIPIASLQQWLGGNLPIVRCMPNTPALLKTGASGLFASPQVSPTQRGQAEMLLGAVGIVEWVKQEVLIDAVTAVSGSGPAYFFLVMELMEKIGGELGLNCETANKLTIQTALGAAQMAREGNISLSELRRRVTSPGGTTERAIQSFEEQGLENLFRNAMQACMERAREMSDEFSATDKE